MLLPMAGRNPAPSPWHASVILAPCDASSQVPRAGAAYRPVRQAVPCVWDYSAAPSHALGPYAPACSGYGRWTVNGSTVCFRAGP